MAYVSDHYRRSSDPSAPMLSNDTYRLKLQQTTASIRAWSGFVADVARVEVAEEANSWRLALTPFAAGACPIELVLDGSSPNCDLRIGRETYEDWPMPSLDDVLPLVEAVCDGRVVTRQVSSAATGLPLTVSTRIKLANGRTFVLPEGADSAFGNSGVESRDTHYLPYRKPTGLDKIGRDQCIIRSQA